MLRISEAQFVIDSTVGSELSNPVVLMKQESPSSENTPGLAVDLAALGLSGEVKVVWNGKEAYAGPAKELELGKEPPDKRQRR